MESKPSRIPRRISVQPSSSLSARMMSGSRGSSFSDTYHTRDSSFRLDSEYQAEYEFISSGLYLVVLLHLCEQSFSDMMGNTNEPSTRVRFINLARTLQAHMEDLESRWNFRSLDLLNLLLQIKPTGQNLSIYFLTKLELCLQA
ncbi:E3 ubiquitin-protein ligase MARCH7 [Tupaia chinensis]|uniref:RING-type E3 ubiquitin transferase n=1 Tax=Tupaia chinensis TaxID=246437 RepID=L9JA11_TUPCH|nr:E3 ubiquitin-protein ligase MARCH7 [Tupaia chinensis]